ncbi:sigma-54 dependent transcriptional regulator [Deferribacterales bacterium Es71-Z0220]|uniref:sigma-54-dependent transcriptional regulator n=1 Tax=Deferrivibrio essentukiensis TaxID=2880922 RepID=UPI001F5FF6AD|nr:sigma-54 dependent transcriptional regulator [Deferrivibrio essentukiensis]MCB4204889.1 sigma-54 dependent transcriptional regulator [Deferrivibrio essentukiensis]
MNVLVIDDQKSICYSLRRLLEQKGMHVVLAYDGTSGLKLFYGNIFDIIFLDVKLPDIDGLELLEKLSSSNFAESNTKVIVMTAFHETDIAIDAMKKGAFDYILKPFDSDQLNSIISNILKEDKEQDFGTYLCVQNDNDCNEKIISNSTHMLDTIKKIGKISQTDESVLITGETGTGKEIVAKALHNFSKRRNKNFVAINCSSIPADLLESELFGYEKGAFTGASNDHIGKLEFAEGGTVFLDEIGDMPLTLQAKILRVLQEREIVKLGSNKIKKINVRFIAATNRNIPELVNLKLFRNDLYYRLNTFEINLKPLRERKDDIIPLCKYFLSKYADRKIKLTQKAADKLIKYDYPGNIRELENIIKRAVINGSDVIHADDIAIINESQKEDLAFASLLSEYEELIESNGLNDFILKIEENIANSFYIKYGKNQVLTADKLKVSRNKLRKLLGLDD